MDIAKTIEDLVKKLKLDKVLSDLFSKDPLKAVEKTLGVKLPDDQMKAIVDGVKAKLSVDKAGEALGAVKGLFGKK
ncbi:MAG: SMI1/KNR4 family protein [Clostridiaceae bacterium]|nr:SMI1/KNR4 family protein [Clostridiaceae bacterium]